MTTIITRGYETVNYSLTLTLGVQTGTIGLPAQDWTPQGLLDYITNAIIVAIDTDGFTLIATYDEATGKSRWAIDYINYSESGSYIEASPDLSQALGLGGGQITPALVKSLNFGVTYNFY